MLTMIKTPNPFSKKDKIYVTNNSSKSMEEDIPIKKNHISNQN